MIYYTINPYFKKITWLKTQSTPLRYGRKQVLFFFSNSFQSKFSRDLSKKNKKFRKNFVFLVLDSVEKP